MLFRNEREDSKIIAFIKEEFDNKGNVTLEVNSSYVKFNDDYSDGYEIIRKEDSVRIVAKNERSLIYALYDLEIGEEGLSIPQFNRRGNVFEVIDDISYLKQQISFGAKYGFNEYFFTFMLWDKVKEFISEDLVKRGFELTLGGHSLSYLLKDIPHFQTMTSKNTHVFNDANLTQLLIEKISAQCAQEPLISRISLWPEDLGIGQNEGAEFLNSYISFCEKLKKELEKKELDVTVEHIVYNAGLAWSMLDKPSEIIPSPDLEILYAYWGRDYRNAINGRELVALKDWHKDGNKLTVFEYYSDYYMMSELYPPLINRIVLDASEMKDLNVEGMLNLNVPYFKSTLFLEYQDTFDWKNHHQFNNYCYAQAMWGKTKEQILKSWFKNTINSTKWCSFIDELEQKLSFVTAYNKTLFPHRIVDTPEMSLELRRSVRKQLEEAKNILVLNSWIFDIETSEENEILMIQYTKQLQIMINHYHHLFEEGKQNEENIT